MSQLYNFKQIQVVPNHIDFIDVILSKTQRKTPTVVHARFKNSRIRSFYIHKVKFTQQNFNDKLSSILSQFPHLNDIHPFYADLIHVIYSRDHWKLALSQVKMARNYIDKIAKHYVLIIKQADSLFRCKNLKRAALGRMCSVIKKLKTSLGYLEEVRQNLSRLPSINPNERTMILCGFPNVGKSSFLNKITNAKVDVQEFAFTTKAVSIGHTHYHDLRWQVLDTPGILDRPLNERNTIELQAITALAHIPGCILYFIDISEDCKYRLEQQVNLFQEIKELFVGKPLVIVSNKSDLMKIDQLDKDGKKQLNRLTDNGKIKIIEMSNQDGNGIKQVKKYACDTLLEHRISLKKRGKRVEKIKNLLYIAEPKDGVKKNRKVIPKKVKAKLKDISLDDGGMEIEKKTTERELERKNGGAGRYLYDFRKKWLLANPDHKYDVIPEIMDGMNVADFYTADIEEKYKALEAEEEKILQQLMELGEDDWSLTAEEEGEKVLADKIRKEKKLKQADQRLRNRNNSRVLPRKFGVSDEVIDRQIARLEKLGVDVTSVRSQSLAVREKRRVRKRKFSAMTEALEEKKSNMLRYKRNEKTYGDDQIKEVRKKQKSAYIEKIRQPDNYDAMPKHLFSGKRGIGKTDRR